MAVSFITAAQRARYGRYPEVMTPDDLARCFHLSDDDRVQIMSCRGHHNRLGFALQLSTVRYLGTFLEDPIAVPSMVDTLLAARPEATSVRLENVGHYPMIEAPARFVEAVLPGLT